MPRRALVEQARRAVPGTLKFRRARRRTAGRPASPRSRCCAARRTGQPRPSPAAATAANRPASQSLFIALPFQPRVDGRGDRLGIGLAAQRRHDVAAAVSRATSRHGFHRTGADFADPALGFARLRGDFGIGMGGRRVEILLDLGPRLGDDLLRLGPGIDQRLVDRRPRPSSASRFNSSAAARSLVIAPWRSARIAADPRQRHPRQHQ